MNHPLIKSFEIRPFWKKIDWTNPLNRFAFYIQTVIVTSLHFSFTLVLTSQFSIRLINIVGLSPGTLNYLFSKFWFNLFIGMIIGLLLLYFMITRKQYPIVDDYYALKESIQSYLYSSDPEKFDNGEFLTIKYYLIYWVVSIIIGIISSFYYFIILYIPIFILYILSELIFINFSSFNTALLLANIVSWISLYSFIFINLTKYKENKPQHNMSQVDVVYSDRTFEIMASNNPPIICPACRSYIPSNSKFCSVCGEKILE